jgi:copper chaperone CopZ
MIPSLRILSVAALLAAVPAAYAGGETCAASAAKTGAACSTSAKAGACSADKAQQVTLKLKESGCSEATAKYSMAVAKLDGVKAVDTCGQSEFTKVSYDGAKVCSSKILAALKDAGAQVEAQRLTLAVDGMKCGSCSDTLTKTLTAVPGVSNAEACHVGKHATIVFNPEQISTDKLVAALDAAGFKATTEAAN